MGLTYIILIFFKRFLKVSSLLFIILILLSSKAFAGVTYVTKVSITDQDTDPRDVQFNTDGTKMFVLGGTGDDVNVYTLSTGFDLTSTVTFVDSYDLSDDLTTNATPTGLAFNSDGTKMFIAEFSTKDLILEYTLSTGFDLFSTVNFVGSYDAGDQEDQIIDVKFNSDGTKMFVVGWRGDDVNEYTLSTGFDLSSTVTFVDSYDVGDQDNQPLGLAFNSDGTKMFVGGNDGDDINVYTLSTGFDVTSTITFDGRLDVNSKSNAPTGLAFNSDGTKMFVVNSGWVPNSILEYTLTTGFDVVNTTPTLSSSSPADGATSVGADDNIVLTFSEAVDAESGNIVIKKSSDDSTVETIDVTGAKVSGSGSTTITINPSTTLDGETSYYITIAATAFDDADSASYAGFSNSTTLNFTTESSTTDPLTDKDVVGSIEAQTEAPKRIVQHVRTPVLNRMDWLRRHRKENNLTNQNIKFQFSNAMLTSLSKVMPVAAKVNEASNKLSDKWSFWSEGSISVGKIGDTSSSSSKDIDSNGITIGMDNKIDENRMYGYALRFGRDEVEVGSSGTSLDTNAYSLSLYGTFPHDDTKFIDSFLGVSSLKTDHVRKSGANTLTGERSGRQVFGSINFRTTYNKDKFNITPSGRIDLGYTELSEYSETGTDALIYDKQQIETGMVSIGIRLDDTIQFNNLTFKPNGRLEYGANFSPSSNATVSYVSDPSTDYTLSIAHEETHNIRAGLGFDFITENGLTIMANYERDQSDNSHSDTLYLGASYISNRETEYAMVLDDNKAIFDYKRNINGFNFTVGSNYTLMSEIPDYAANLEISNTF